MRLVTKAAELWMLWGLVCTIPQKAIVWSYLDSWGVATATIVVVVSRCSVRKRVISVATNMEQMLPTL
jgi:hypothetical protein